MNVTITPVLPGAPAAAANRNQRLLVIDDNPAIHEDFRKILQGTRTFSNALEDARKSLFGRSSGPNLRANFDIDSAFQGQEGLQKVQEARSAGSPYALAFVDVRMPPGWDGIETIRHLWQADPELQVVICTAYSDYSWEDIVRQLGQSDNLVILKKPFDHVEVLQLAHALSKKWLLNQQVLRERNDLEKLIGQRTAELEASNQTLKSEIREHAQSEERFTKAFRASPIPLAIRTLHQDRFVDANESFLQMTGFSREHLIGRGAAELGLWVQNDQEARLLQLLLEQKRIRNIETQINVRSDSHRTILLSAELFELGTEPHVLIIAQDVTERVSLENQLRQSQKMEAVGQLAAGVAHDFNNLLTVIHGYSSLQLERAGLDGDITRALEHVKSAAERAAGLTRQLLAFSRKQLLQRQPLRLNEVIERMRDMLSRLIGETIVLDCELAAELPQVVGDEANLGQVILNLVVNARDAMPSGGQIHLSTCSVDWAPPLSNSEAVSCKTGERRAGRFICLTVTDEGTGMDQEVLNRLFEPFFSTKPVGKGTGLGLSTVYGIVKQHAGWVEVSSQLGQGSTFHVFPPAAAPGDGTATDDLAASEALRPQTRPELGGGETVLVVEDEILVRDLVCVTLAQHGYRILQAGSGPEALEVARSCGQPIDLLLTDMVMPNGMTGSALAERLLQQSDRLKVVFTSGYSAEMLESDTPTIEGLNFLAKPYEPVKLLKTVRRCLDSAPAPVGAAMN